MSDEQPAFGYIAFADLTIPNAEEIRDFYVDVVGWQSMPLELEDAGGKYDDYMISDSTGQRVAGICHARGENASLPPQWMIYAPVGDLAASLALVNELGGEIIREQRDGAGNAMYAWIKDPGGSYMGLMQGKQE